MEYSKNEMYQRVGRERTGWVQATPDVGEELAELIITEPAPVTLTVPEAIPAPPMVEMPGGPDELCATPAMAYVPYQKWEDVYEAEAGLKRGTIFAQLDLPFVGEGACNGE